MTLRCGPPADRRAPDIGRRPSPCKTLRVPARACSRSQVAGCRPSSGLSKVDVPEAALIRTRLTSWRTHTCARPPAARLSSAPPQDSRSRCSCRSPGPQPRTTPVSRGGSPRTTDGTTDATTGRTTAGTTGATPPEGGPQGAQARAQGGPQRLPGRPARRQQRLPVERRRHRRARRPGEGPAHRDRPGAHHRREAGLPRRRRRPDGDARRRDRPGRDRHIGTLKKKYAQFEPLSRDRFLAGALTPAEWIFKSQCLRVWFREQMAGVFSRYDVLVAPATPISAPVIGTE